jgi:hypothetical protein
MEADTPKNAIGRPSDYTADLAELICERLADGESLRAICREDEMPDKKTVLRWIRKHDDFRAQYAQARESQAEHFLEEIIEIADDSSGDTEYGDSGPKANNEWINRSKLRVETRKWAMSKMAPKKYGDKLDVTSGDKPLPGKTIIKIGGKRPKPDADGPTDT